MKMAGKRDSRLANALVPRPTPRRSRSTRKPDEIRLCSGCRKQIITRRRTAEGDIVSEYFGFRTGNRHVHLSQVGAMVVHRTDG